MKKLTYKEAYDKIIEAYFKDEIKPFEPRFCFCGTLCDTTDKWVNYNPDMIGLHHKPYAGYLAKDFCKMEVALLTPLHEGTTAASIYHPYYGGCDTINSKTKSQNYEENLFAGMCAALDVLKEIHRARGENVDEVPQLEKRKLSKVLNDR